MRWVRPSADAALQRQQAREHAERGVAAGHVDHAKHGGGGHMGQYGGGLF